MPSQRRRLPGGARYTGETRKSIPLTAYESSTDSRNPRADYFGPAQRHDYPFRLRNCMKCVLGSTGYYEPSKVITGLDSFEKISDATGLNVLDLVNDPEGGASIAREILGIDEETALKVMGCAARVAGSRAMGMFNQDPNGCDDYYMRGDVIWSKE